MKWFKRIAFSLAFVFVLAAVYVGLFDVYLPARHLAPQWAQSLVPDHAVLAHRGASWLAPEETEPAFLLARDLGADYVELDVQRTKDSVLVAFHDSTVARTTDCARVFPGREKQGIGEFTLAELKELDAGSWFNKAYPARARAKYAGLKILTLDEVCAIIEAAPKSRMYVETKCSERYPGYEEQLVRLLDKRGWLKEPGRVIFQSFSLASLQRLQELAPNVPRSYLFNNDTVKQDGWKKVVADAQRVAKNAGPAGYAALPWHCGRMHRAGLVVHPYVVNAKWQFRLMHLWGCDGFFTDRCDQLLEFYGRALPATPDAILAKHGY